MSDYSENRTRVLLNDFDQMFLKLTVFKKAFGLEFFWLWKFVWIVHYSQK